MFADRRASALKLEHLGFWMGNPCSCLDKLLNLWLCDKSHSTFWSQSSLVVDSFSVQFCFLLWLHACPMFAEKRQIKVQCALWEQCMRDIDKGTHALKSVPFFHICVSFASKHSGVVPKVCRNAARWRLRVFSLSETYHASYTHAQKCKEGISFRQCANWKARRDQKKSLFSEERALLRFCRYKYPLNRCWKHALVQTTNCFRGICGSRSWFLQQTKFQSTSTTLRVAILPNGWLETCCSAILYNLQWQNPSTVWKKIAWLWVLFVADIATRSSRKRDGTASSSRVVWVWSWKQSTCCCKYFLRQSPSVLFCSVLFAASFKIASGARFQAYFDRKHKPRLFDFRDSFCQLRNSVLRRGGRTRRFLLSAPATRSITAQFAAEYNHSKPSSEANAILTLRLHKLRLLSERTLISFNGRGVCGVRRVQVNIDRYRRQPSNRADIRGREVRDFSSHPWKQLWDFVVFLQGIPISNFWNLQSRSVDE